MRISESIFQNRLKSVVVSCSLAATLTLVGAVSPFCSMQPADAAIGSDPRLGQLEVKFFKHTYPKDEEAVRLERLEKMIFGESKSGAAEARLKALADTVPNLAEIAKEEAQAASGASEETASSGSSSSSGNSSNSVSAARGKRGKAKDDSSNDLAEERSKTKPGGQVLSGESKYPAVTALEQHIFNRDYAAEAVGDRLNRLETKVFGKPSKFTDLSERVDALKEKSRVDIARQAPPGSDWIDDDDDDINFPAPRPVARSPVRSEPVARTDGDDGRSFSGRDLRKDMQNAFGTRSGGGYGMSGSGSSASSSGGGASGAYGMGAGASAGLASAGSYGSGMPATAPRRKSAGAGSGSSSSAGAGAINGGGSDRFDDAPPVGAIGLSSKVTALENAVLGKTYAKDPLIERVGRLEETVFPSKSDTASSLSLPERVAKLVEKVPIASAPPKSARANRGRSRDDFDMDDDMDMGSGMGSMSSLGAGSGGMTMSQTTRSGGLGKIINSIGSMLGGGYGGYAGAYGMPTGTLVRDPSTGYMVDSMSGNLINPSTGQIVGRSAGYPSSVYTNGIGGGYSSGYGTGLGAYPGMSAGYGVPIGGIPVGGMPIGGMPIGGMPMGGYSSFNNGFSPYGFPGGGYGLGGGGIRFGGGNFGVRF